MVVRFAAGHGGVGGPVDLYAFADMKEDIDAWIEAIRRVIHAQSLPPPPPPPTADAAPSLPPPPPPPRARSEDDDAKRAFRTPPVRRDLHPPPIPKADEVVPDVLGSGSLSGGLVGNSRMGRSSERARTLIEVVRQAKQRTCKVFSCGAATHGQDGHGARLEPGRATAAVIEMLKARLEATCVAAGDDHAAVITRDRQLFLWGDGSEGQLGCGADVRESLRPFLCVPLRRTPVVSVACGAQHTLVSLQDGRVMAFGAGADGQLGAGRDVRQSWEPIEVAGLPPSPDDPPFVAAGTLASGALFRDGSLYVWGSNRAKQLPVSAEMSLESTLWTATPAETPVSPVLHVAFADAFSLLIAGPQRRLFITGCPTLSRRAVSRLLSGDTSVLPPSSSARIREAKTSPLSAIPGSATSGHTSKPKSIIDVMDIAAGSSMAGAVAFNGNVYSIGRGFLGAAPDSAVAAASRRARVAEEDGMEEEAGGGWMSSDGLVSVPGLGLEGVTSIACGHHHTVVGTSGGDLWGWGSGLQGQLGHGRFASSLEPVPCATFLGNDTHYEGVACGGMFTLALQLPGSRGAARSHFLAEKYASLWLQRALGRKLSKTKRKSKRLSALNGMVQSIMEEEGLDALMPGMTMADLLSALGASPQEDAGDGRGEGAEGGGEGGGEGAEGGGEGGGEGGEGEAAGGGEGGEGEAAGGGGGGGLSLR